jgi:hypothetical protein
MAAITPSSADESTHDNKAGGEVVTVLKRLAGKPGKAKTIN